MARDAIHWLAAQVRILQRRVQELEKTKVAENDQLESVGKSRENYVHEFAENYVHESISESVENCKHESVGESEENYVQESVGEPVENYGHESVENYMHESVGEAVENYVHEVDMEKTDEGTGNAMGVIMEHAENDNYEKALQAYQENFTEEVWKECTKGLEDMGDATLGEMHQQIIIAIFVKIDHEQLQPLLPIIYEMGLKMIVKRWKSYCGHLGVDEACRDRFKFYELVKEDMTEVAAELVEKGKQLLLLDQG